MRSSPTSRRRFAKRWAVWVAVAVTATLGLAHAQEAVVADAAVEDAVLATPVKVFGRRAPVAEKGLIDLGTVPGSGRLSVEFVAVAVSEVADYIARVGRCNVVLAEGLEGTISIRFLADTPEEALKKLALAAGASLRREALNTYRLVPLPKVSLGFSDADVVQVIKTIAKMADGNVVIADNIQGTLSLQLEDVTWRAALDNVVKTAGFELVEEANGILRIVTIETLREQRATEVFPLRYVQPPPEYRPVIDTDFAAGAPTGTETGRSFSGRGGPAGSGSAATAFPLLNAVTNVLSAVGAVEYDAYSNALVVTDIRPSIGKASEVIRLVDVRPQQVFIDVKFVATSNTDLLNYGVDYRNIDGNSNMGFSVDINGGSMSTPFPFKAGSGGWFDSVLLVDNGPPWVKYDPATGLPDPSGTFIPANGGYQYGNLRFNQFQLIMTLLKRDVNTVTLQAPKILTLDNSEATIFVGRTVRWAETFSTSNQAGGVEVGIREADNSPVNTGLQLLVIPHIVKGTDNIILELIPEDRALSGTGSTIPGFDDFDSGTAQIQLPRIASRTVVTKLRIKSGNTAVLGGLVDERHSETIRKIPFLGDIPVFGWAFKSRVIQKNKSNLLLFITAWIVSDDSDVERIHTVHRPYEGGTISDVQKMFHDVIIDDRDLSAKTMLADEAETAREFDDDDGNAASQAAREEKRVEDEDATIFTD